MTSSSTVQVTLEAWGIDIEELEPDVERDEDDDNGYRSTFERRGRCVAVLSDKGRRCKNAQGHLNEVCSTHYRSDDPLRTDSDTRRLVYELRS